jgi:hypothetical protein
VFTLSFCYFTRCISHGAVLTMLRFLLMEDRIQSERRVVRRGTYSVVFHGTVFF